MPTTPKQQTEDAAAFAAEFDAADAEPSAQSEDEAFGLAEEAGAGAEDPAGVPAAASDAGPAAAEPPGDEAQLQAKEAELAAEEGALDTSSVGESQESEDVTDPAADAGATDGTDDPEKALADDFGPEFVDLMKRLIAKVCADKVGEGLGTLSSTVDEVIQHLQGERNANHFKAIAAAHEDFTDIVESPEFSAWKDGQEPAEQARLAQVIDAGSTQEIIDMLTDYKASKGGGVDDSEIDGAEGVRSSGLTLPKEPSGDDDFAAAWNEH
ncbi:hypothetical protein CR152_32130 (plasmid) [Massilia violaceinigra]|uniref:Uncharacterized protein n=1 Tax=Massilia violaceinigra TaxID=2045208 RepID=A0A2D2DW75_9BURK|nr:hypothetical protein [Massilia violaceinigra]ATQ79225.1 hypothetical protein CR152_32130 [Massilia violaceinigra]